MRRIFNFVFTIIFIVGLVVSYRYVSRFFNPTETITGDPLVRLARNILVQATPEILPDPVTIVRQVNQLARLETASFEGEKVITAEQGFEGLFGAFEERLIFVAYGEVIAGVDLQKMGTADIQVVDPNTVMIHLPEAEVFVSTLDNDLSYVADRDTGLLTNADPELETKARQAGEEAILEAALEYGVLTSANENAEEYLQGFLNGLGFETVIFTEDVPPPPAVPYQQEIPKGYILTTPTP